MPSGQEHVPRLAPDAHGPGGGPGFLGARAVHGPDGAVGVFPPREPGRLDLPLPVAEHDGPVAVPFHGDDRPVRKHCLLTAAAQTSHGPVRMHDLRRAIGVVFFGTAEVCVKGQTPSATPAVRVRLPSSSRRSRTLNTRTLKRSRTRADRVSERGARSCHRQAEVKQQT